MANAGRSFSAVLSFVCVAGGLALVACSGASDQDVLAGSSEANDTSPSDPASSNSPPPSTTQPDAPATQPASTDTPTPAPSPAPAGPTCAPGLEPNDDLAHATPFQSSICGKIDGPTDVDYVSFVVPNDAETVDVKHTEMNGKVAFRYFLGGVPLGTDGSALAAIPGATYVVQIRLDQNGNKKTLPSYEIDVSFK